MLIQIWETVTFRISAHLGGEGRPHAGPEAVVRILHTRGGGAVQELVVDKCDSTVSIIIVSHLSSDFGESLGVVVHHKEVRVMYVENLVSVGSR